MTRTTLIARLFRLVLPRVVGFGVPANAGAVRPRRGIGRKALAWFAAAFLGLNAAALLAMDVVWPELRDPEYGRRLNQLKARMAEHPDRPAVVVIGSSRAAMGVRPGAWEEVRPGSARDPLLFNMSLVGSGPLMELFCLRRLYTDGVKPGAVVFEYWPPFLREDGPYLEADRIDANRYYRSDRPFVREFGRNPDDVERQMRRARVNPLGENGYRWLGQAFPSWLPWTKRADVAWAGLDEWGWLPGIDETNPPEPTMRQARLAHCEAIYREQFEGYAVHPLADRGLREAVALARSNGARVAFVYLPESSEFRGWMPPAVVRVSRAHLDGLCRELDIPLIDARLWLADGFLVDGFHLSRLGAAEFTRRFGPAVAAAFPGLEPCR